MPLCRVCSAYITAHPSLKGWLKCNACGYSRVAKYMVTLKDYLMGRDEKYARELTHEVTSNAAILLERVNALLTELAWKDKVVVSSGWRPASINSATPNAAKRSAHMTGKAVDLLDDKNHTLAKLILSKPELLERFDLWIEDYASTTGTYTNWVHLDIVPRSKRPVRSFKP